MDVSHTQTLILPTSSAVVSQVPVESESYPYITLSQDNLAGAEEVDIYHLAGATWKVVNDLSGNPIKLTSSVTIVTLDGGPTYGVLKDATAGLCGVYWTPGSRLV